MAEKEYISRESVLKCVEEDGHDNEFDLGYYDHNVAFQEIIKEIPAADVRPVVRGHWERSFWFVTCSVCEYTSADTDDEGSDIALNFCPNCGADMREEKNTG